MYNDTIKVAGKIITLEDLSNIFFKMWENLEQLNKIYKQEQSANQMLDRDDQVWTLKDFNGYLSFCVDFYDDTNIKFDNFHNFMSIFNTRANEIKSIDVRYNCYYSKMQNGYCGDIVTQNINIDIYEHTMSIDLKLDSSDKKMDEIYELIKKIVLNAPYKYDDTISRKKVITNKISIIRGIIPAVIIAILLLFIPVVRQIYASTYVLFPIVCLLLGYIIGDTLFSGKIDNLYNNLIRDKKYVKYDIDSRKEIYEDDIDAYKDKAEILIGRNINNLDYRKELIDMENKYKKYLPYELGVIALLSIIVLFLGNI